MHTKSKHRRHPPNASDFEKWCRLCARVFSSCCALSRSFSSFFVVVVKSILKNSFENCQNQLQNIWRQLILIVWSRMNWRKARKKCFATHTHTHTWTYMSYCKARWRFDRALCFFTLRSFFDFVFFCHVQRCCNWACARTLKRSNVSTRYCFFLFQLVFVVVFHFSTKMNSRAHSLFIFVTKWMQSSQWWW